MKSVRYCLISLSLIVCAMQPTAACGGAWYATQELAPLSLVDPRMADLPEWQEFFGYASPPIGLGLVAAVEGEWPRQPVIQVERVPQSSGHLVNRLFEYDSEWCDAAVHEANIIEWREYFRRTFGRDLDAESTGRIVDDGQLPAWLDGPTQRYLEYLREPVLSRNDLLARARDKKSRSFLRDRWAFQAVRRDSLADGGDTGPTTFRALAPAMDRNGLAYWRAMAWQARQKPGNGGLLDYLKVFEARPELRSQVFASLMNHYTPADFAGIADDAGQPPEIRQSAAFAGFLVGGRDFSAATLARMTALDGGKGRSRFMILRMIERIELEGGNVGFDLLIAPLPAGRPRGIYSALIDQASATAEAAEAADGETRAFWLEVASYLCLFDGDAPRMASLLDRSQGLKSTIRTAAFRSLLVLLVDLVRAQGRELPAGVQDRYLAALRLAAHQKSLGDNRGLYQSLAVILARKYLSLSRLDLAALAFGLLDDPNWFNPYRLSDDDRFWAGYGYAAQPFNYLVDALMDPEELQSWKTLLGPGPKTALQAWLAGQSVLDGHDLDYLTAIKHLRRGQPALARPLVDALDRDGFFRGEGHFRDGASRLPAKRFQYSTSLSVWDPGRPADLREIGLPELVVRLEAIQTRIRALGSAPLKEADGEFLLESAAVYFNLQLTGFPLVFSDTPRVIHFVNDFDYYPYPDGRGGALAIPGLGDDLARRGRAFQENELNPGRRARALLQAVVNFKPDPEQEVLALALLARLDPEAAADWKGRTAVARYAGSDLLATLRATCEGY